MDTPNLRRNGQVDQPNIEQSPEGNGWPTPLTDESNPVGQKISVGKNGESIMNDGTKTSQDTWSLTEGTSTGGAGQPDTSDGAQKARDVLKTSQQSDGAHSLPEGR